MVIFCKQDYSCQRYTMYQFERCKLFQILQTRAIPDVILRLIFDMYTRQEICTKWNSSKSHPFGTSNGVKQGAILSPILFCVYIDELLNQINKSGLGCHVGHLPFACIGYADDVCLLSPSVAALQKMLYICESFAVECHVMFNPKKTTCIAIGSDGKLPSKNLYLNGSSISWTNRVKHLGNVINFDLSDKEDILYKKSVFITQVNSLNSKFASVQSLIRGKLLQTFCCSWYGSQNWDASDKYVSQLNTEWNKAVRRTLRLPYRTHRNLLPAIIRSNSFSVQHLQRLKKFCSTFMTSSNDHVLYIGKRAAGNTNGTLGRNMVKIASFSDITESDNSSELDGFNIDEVNIMIESLCCQ